MQKVLRRFSEGFLQVKGFVEGGSVKGASRRYSEGRNTPFVEYDPFGVCLRYPCQCQRPLRHMPRSVKNYEAMTDNQTMNKGPRKGN